MLDASIEKRLKSLLHEIAEDRGFIVHMAEVGEHHPNVAPSYIVKMLKGT